MHMRKMILLNILLCLGYMLNAQTNLIQNPGFETAGVVIKQQTTDLMAGQNPNQWVHLLKAKTNTNVGTVSIATDEKYEGTSSLKVDVEKIGARFDFYLAYELQGLKPAKYTFSFYAKSLNENPVRVEAQGASQAGGKIEADGRFLIGATQKGIAETVTKEWKKYTFELDLTGYTADKIKFVNLILRPNCLQDDKVVNTPNTYWFDNFEFVGDDTVAPLDDFDKMLLTVSNRNELGYNVSNLNSKVEKHLALLTANGEFSDINYKDQSKTNWQPIDHLDRVKDFVFAYTMTQTNYFEKEELYTKIVASLEAWYAQNPTSKNWWNIEIAIPRSLGLSLIQMRRASKQLPAQLEKKLIDRMAANAGDLSKEEGANLTDVATDYFYRACLTKDQDMLDLSISAAYGPLKIVDKGNQGFQHDMSFHQHGPQLYIGGYGDELIKGVTNFALNTMGTNYALEGKQLAVLSEFVRNVYFGAMRGQYMHYNAIGRSVSRANATNKSSMSRNIETLQLQLDPANSVEYADGIKRMKGQEPANYKIEASNKFYPQSDYVVHARPDYSFSVRAVSDRTSHIENGNKENLLSYFMTFGSTVMMQTGSEYADIFPVWNWNRVPGVTNPQVSKMPLRGDWGIMGTEKFVGGASDNMYAVMAYAHKDDQIKDEVTTAQKAWFLFDDEIVSLGAGIQSTSAFAINTTLEQSLLLGDVTVFNSKAEAKLNKDSEQTYDQTATWVHHNNMGYVFPNGGKVSVSNKTQKGTWQAINNNQGDAQVFKDVFTLYFDHGVKPSAGSYAYILLPNKKVADVKAYNASNIEIVANTADMQAVVHKGLNICQVVFYKAGKLEYKDMTIEADKPSVVMLRDFKAPKPKLTVADPTQSKVKVTVKVAFATAPTEPVVTVADFTAEKIETAGVSKTFEIEAPSTIVYGKNLIKNPSFEEDTNVPENITVHPKSAEFPNRWNLTVTTGNGDKGELSVVKDMAQHEQNSMKVNLESISARYRFYLNHDILDARPGVYEFSFYTKANVADRPFRVEVIGFNAFGTAYDKGKDLMFNEKGNVGIEKQTTTDWVKHTFTLDLSSTPKEELKVLRLILRPNCKQDGNPVKQPTTYWFDNFVFHEVMDGSNIESIQLGETLKAGLKLMEGDMDYNLLEPMHFTLNPTGANVEDVVYNVQDANVIEINEGIVKVKAAGTTTVVLSSAKDAAIKSESFTVTVEPKNAGPNLQSITLTSALKNGLKFLSSSTGYSLINGNKLEPIGNEGYSIIDLFILDPADHPIADLKFTSTKPEVATIDDNGVVVFGTELGVAEFTISSRLKPKVVSEKFKITVEKSSDASVHKLLINGEAVTLTKNAYKHNLQCDDDKTITVDIETEQDASIDIKKSFEVKMGVLPEGTIIRFSIIPANGIVKDKEDYTLTFENRNYSETKDIVNLKFNKRLIVNNNSKTNGGFTFTKYFWSVNGIENEGKQIYSTGDKEISTTDEFALRLISVKDKETVELKVCPFKVELRETASVVVYPNPANVGEVLNIKATMPQGTNYANSRVDIISMSGNVVKTTKLTGAETQVESPSTSGMYIVKVVCDGHNSEFKIIVK